MGNKRILVAGGAGFVGSHLCAYLLKQGQKIFCVDNLSTGKKRTIKSQLKNPNFVFLKKDVSLPFYLKVDEIYHLASPASVVTYSKLPLETFRANVFGTWNLLQLAKKTKAKFLLASTSEIYGDPLVHPQSETYFGNVNPTGPRSSYDESKRAAEALCVAFAKSHKLDVKIVRIFNAYGPNIAIDDGRVVSNFIAQALQNKPLTIYGNGRQTRSFQYVDDLISGLTKMMAAKKFSGPVNLGNPQEFKVIDLAKLVIKLTNSKSKVIYKNLPTEDPKQRKPDITLAKNKLNWRPKVQLRSGLIKTIAAFKTKLV